MLARGLSPLEHTAIDLALTQTVRENAVPILSMVVDRLNPSTDTDGRLVEDGSRAAGNEELPQHRQSRREPG